MARFTQTIIALALLAPASAFAYVPFAHEGSMILPMDGHVLEGRAIFSTEVSEFGATGVLIRGVFVLPSGGEGYLTVDLRLSIDGLPAASHFVYYEKLSADLVSFEAHDVDAQVVVIDWFEGEGDTSLHVEIDGVFSDGSNTRTVTAGYAVTAPAPNVLRGGTLPGGVVVVEDPATPLYAGGSYDRGHLDCYGHPETVVVVDDYEDEVVIVYDDDDEERYDDDYYYDDDYDSSYDNDDDSGPMCDGDSTNDSSTSSSSSSSSDNDSGDFDCEGDAEASSGARRFCNAPTNRAAVRRQRTARRIIAVSPMLLLMLGLLLLRRNAQY